MTLNIGSAQSNNASEASASAQSAPAPAVPRPLVTEVIDELSHVNPGDFIAAFRRWHHGSISLAHLNVLMLIAAEGPMSMSRLADALDVSVASATGIVDRMETRGLVERRHDTEDRRVVLVDRAPAADTLFRDISEQRRAHLGALLDRLSDDDLAALLRGQRALRAARQSMRSMAEPGEESSSAETAR